MGAQKSKLGKKDLQELAKKTSCKYFFNCSTRFGEKLHLGKIPRLWYQESPTYRYRTIDHKFVD